MLSVSYDYVSKIANVFHVGFQRFSYRNLPLYRAIAMCTVLADSVLQAAISIVNIEQWQMGLIGTVSQ